MSTARTALYFHIPFCVHRCAYCDFNTYAGKEALIPAYLQAVCREIDYLASATPEPLVPATIFFGGGTPSLLSAEQFSHILSTVRRDFDPPAWSELEISLEANPCTLTQAGLQGLRRAGFNRLSLGMQSAHPEELHLLERIQIVQPRLAVFGK